jgi:hypothetical protein
VRWVWSKPGERSNAHALFFGFSFDVFQLPDASLKLKPKLSRSCRPLEDAYTHMTACTSSGLPSLRLAAVADERRDTVPFESVRTAQSHPA